MTGPGWLAPWERAAPAALHLTRDHAELGQRVLFALAAETANPRQAIARRGRDRAVILRAEQIINGRGT